MRIATILGARPQFIKASVVSRALAHYPKCEEALIHTGQHYDANLSEVFFAELGMPEPAFRLGIASAPDVPHTARMMEALDAVLAELSPDLVLVYGDTNSTLAGALAAAKRKIEVAHVEAGLRSHNRQMQEEINRVVTDHVATVLFAPTKAAHDQLLREGIHETAIHQVGDVMYDVALRHRERAIAESMILMRLGIAANAYILATIHRAENADNRARLSAILGGLAELAREYPVVLPLHPRTRRTIEADDDLRDFARALLVTEPVGYLDMARLQAGATVIATDSGGVQKEAYFHCVPCVTFREETEWQELVESGWNRLCPPSSVRAVSAALRSAIGVHGEEAGKLYGDGRAAERIAAILAS